MPTYEYRCTDCGHELEAVQSFSEPALTECPQCGNSSLRKLFGNVGVVFKGSGFYRNDSRSDGKPAAKSAGKDTTDTPSKSEKSGAADKPKESTKKDSAATPSTSTGAAKPKSGTGSSA